MSDGELKRFETRSPQLAAFVLAKIQDAIYEGVGVEASQDGERPIIIKYHPRNESYLNELIEEFREKDGTANIYLYNRAFNKIRDDLKRAKGAGVR